MTDVRVTTTRGTDMVLDEATVQGFQTSLRGALLRPGDADYDEARKVWNANVDKRPALIARGVGVSDVINAVNFARANDLLVSVRGGGHNIPGNCVCNGGLVLDLTRMKGIRVDPTRRTVRAEGGVKWGEFDHETQAFGLATPGGTDAESVVAESGRVKTAKVKVLARAYPERIAGTAARWSFSERSGVFRLSYRPRGRGPSVVVVPRASYPRGACTSGRGFTQSPDSEPNRLRLRAERGARHVALRAVPCPSV